MDHRQTVERVAEIVRQYRRRIEQELDCAVEVRLFGSYARGTATEESDVDVLVVVPELNPRVLDRLLDVAWEVGYDAGVVLSVIPVGKNELPKVEKTPFWTQTVREGVLI